MFIQPQPHVGNLYWLNTLRGSLQFTEPFKLSCFPVLAAPSRRKSRSPFADIEFGNPPAPVSSTTDRAPHSHGRAMSPEGSGVGGGSTNAPPEPLPFEQTVPLLAGAVNPTAPLASTKALPSASSRPGVKLKIAPRVKVRFATSYLNSATLRLI